MTDRLGIVHVPKSGGSAVRSALAQIEGFYATPLYYDPAHFGSAELLDAVPEPNRSSIATPEQLTAVVASHRLVIGHYSAPSLVEAGCSELAVQVREPRSRVLSIYRFWQGQDAAERGRWGRWGSLLVAEADKPFGDFLQSSSIWPAVDNSLARQILGVRPTWRSRPAKTQYQRILPILRIVEWSQRSDQFLRRVCGALGSPIVPAPVLGRENVTDVVGEEQVLDRATLRRLERLTRVDSALLRLFMNDGALDPRSPGDLQIEFEATAEKLGFRLP